MTRLTIELDDAVYARLKAAAEERALPVEEYVAALAAEGEGLREGTAAAASAMARAHLDRYPRLFQRLAE